MSFAARQWDLALGMQNQPGHYFPYDCDANIRRFLDTSLAHLENRETLSRELEVIGIVPRSFRDLKIRAQPEQLRPLRALTPGQKWDYHVALRLGERVYDFDDAGKPGTDIRVYARAMFGDQAEHCDALLMSAWRYVRLPANGDIRGTFLSGVWRRMPFQDYVSEVAASYPAVAPTFIGLDDRIRVFKRATPIRAWLLRSAPSAFVAVELLAQLKRARHETLPKAIRAIRNEI